MNGGISARLIDNEPPAISIPRSRVHEVFCAVGEMTRAGRAVLPLHIAEPTPRPAPAVLDAVTRALELPFEYTSVTGLTSFNRALVDKLTTRNRIPAAPERTFVTNGATEALLAIERMLHTTGAEILLPAIHWPLHLQQALLAGFRPRFYPLRHDFGVDPDAVASAASSSTTVLFLNTPHNPTGAVYDRATLERLLHLARERGWAVISDEAYEDFVYDGAHVSIGSLEADLPEHERRVFSVFTFSKSHGLGTCRLGYAAVPSDQAAQALAIVIEMSIMAPSTLIQHAGAAALACEAEVSAVRAAIRSNRDRFLAPLAATDLLRTVPAGGWYTLLDISKSGLTADAFARTLLERSGVAVVPATGFALRPVLDGAGRVLAAPPAPESAHLIRIAYSGSDLDEGLRRIRAFLDETRPRDRAPSHPAESTPP